MLSHIHLQWVQSLVRKSAGPDNLQLSAKFLKEVAFEIAAPNTIIRFFASAQSDITLVYKGAPVDDPCNYLLL